ncbi:DUF3592 domain-containing protein [Sphingomonas sp.]|uniref:DUF3592 domain-containing protein n=1 Tax=Sphingomonas sp. TaxID=28214 RepID=UPI003CC54456
MSDGQVVFWWRTGLTLLGLVLIGCAIGYLIWARARTQNTRSWISAPGVVLWSDLRIVRLEDAWSANSAARYFPQIEYAFQADGERRGTTAFLLGKQFLLRRDADAWLRSVAPGTTVQVWFDPADPDRSALINEKPSLFNSALVALTGAGVIAAGWLVHFSL